MDAKVIYKYEKDQDDELNLNVGDYLVDVVKVDDGWCEGTLKSNGTRGMFPDNFVELITAAARPSPAQPPPPAVIIQPQPPPPQIVETTAPIIRDSHVAKKRKAKVTYSYAADNEDELSLEPGQIVEVLDEEEEGWWRGAINGREGVFPSNFVEPIEETDEPSHPPPTVPKSKERTGRPPSMVAMPGLGGVNPLELKSKLKSVTAKAPVPPPETTTTSRPPPPIEPSKPPPPTAERPRANTGSRTSRPLPKAKVMFTYQATQEDEITIMEGEVVDVLSRDTDQDGWWKIKKGAREGLVPDNFLELLTTEPKMDNPPLPPKKVEAPKPTVPIPGAKSVLPPKLPEKTETPERKEPPSPHPDPVTDELDVPPHNGVLDNSKMKQRPKKNPARPPSRSNLAPDEETEKRPESPPPADNTAEESTGGGAPWQQELKRKNRSNSALPNPTPTTTTPTKGPTPGTRPKPTKASKPLPQTTPKPHPTAPAVPGGSNKTVSASALPSTTSTVSKPIEPKVSDIEESGEWKHEYESLRKEFARFKEELKEDMRILTEDLDNERKKNAQLAIDIDRLKKTAGFR